MLAPCKTCIVKACCQHECTSYIRWRNHASQLIAFISIVISFIIMFSIFRWIVDKPNTQGILGVVWVISVGFNILYTDMKLPKASTFLLNMLGPFTSIIYLIQLDLVKLCKHILT